MTEGTFGFAWSVWGFPLALAFAFILSLLFASLCSFTFGFES